ncbi:hypothetical protein P170DRAFT_477288 [Aspergillus steynii IBT 23096]|uniref:Uncharacterized protein n=1 Tax=Aspergillus steynii IBT 23096 TaxID=1392250 RepID=A0A2I2G0K5_9EURO|nr:uncharacterized protein P170DRAFT_477288 [Aspergillus steynii IBT 23096]PLB46407.1 hypothetical protein P170DRAFT_477288 [Aspergillus steynii IBT 23096]
MVLTLRGSVNVAQLTSMKLYFYLLEKMICLQASIVDGLQINIITEKALERFPDFSRELQISDSEMRVPKSNGGYYLAKDQIELNFSTEDMKFSNTETFYTYKGGDGDLDPSIDVIIGRDSEAVRYFIGDQNAKQQDPLAQHATAAEKMPAKGASTGEVSDEHISHENFTRLACVSVQDKVFPSKIGFYTQAGADVITKAACERMQLEIESCSDVRFRLQSYFSHSEVSATRVVRELKFHLNGDRKIYTGDFFVLDLDLSNNVDIILCSKSLAKNEIVVFSHKLKRNKRSLSVPQRPKDCEKGIPPVAEWERGKPTLSQRANHGGTHRAGRYYY